ncbi:MAG: hypothetical protein ACK5P5_07420 [Pseudobdellovibrionaceae bacterium]
MNQRGNEIPNQYFVYQAYGKAEILQQTLLSIISLLAQTSKVSTFRVLVYTDQIQFFRNVLGTNSCVDYELLTPEKILNWKGQIQFVHRLKIEMLLDVLSGYKGKFIYLDGDTYFLSNPMELFLRINDSDTLMHLPEGQIDVMKDPLSQKLKKFLRREQFQIAGQKRSISTSTIMWNAGVIGFSSVHVDLFQEILNLTDQTYGRYQKHVMEQLSVSVVLQLKTRVHRTDDLIFHYWNQKDDYQNLILQFLSGGEKADQLIEKYGQIIFPPPPKPKLSFLEKIKLWLDSK